MSEVSFNPYVGLRPFRDDENLLFFGRDQQTLELLQRLHYNRFVAVVGSSGSGKSSLIRAGLIPALKGGFLVENSSQWLIGIMKPGQDPMYNLAGTILTQVDPHTPRAEIAAFVTRLKKEGVPAILNVIAPIREKKNSNFFLLVDQFEELFRFSMKQRDIIFQTAAIDFVNTLLKLANQNEIPFYVVLTMRSDFIGDCAQFYGLPGALNKSQYLVPRLNRLELKKVIEGPAKLYGGKFNSALTSRVINDLGNVANELPLVQHLLMRMWAHKQQTAPGTELDLRDYEEMGGIENALSLHADEALQALNGEDRKLAKTIFQALTTVDENGRKIRRPAKLSDLENLTHAGRERILNVIANFIKEGRSFLVIDSMGDTDDMLVDISHESLIRHWKNLNHWVDEETESAVQYKRLCSAYQAYDENRKDLLSGREFEIFEEWYQNFKPTKAWAQRYNDHYNSASEYLANIRKIFNRRKRNARRIKRIKKVAGYSLIAVAFFALYYFFALPSADEKAWNTANEEHTIDGYEAYLDSYQRGIYALTAQDSLAAMNFLQSLKIAWTEAETNNTVKGYENYLNLAAVEKDSLNQVLQYSKLARDTLKALKRIDSLKLEGANSRLDEEAWQNALLQNTVGSYLTYFRNEKIAGKHDKEALARLLEIGKSGFLYSGKLAGNKITDPVFDLVYRNESGFKPNDMLRANDIVVARQPRYIYTDLGVTRKSGNTVKEGEMYFVKSVVLQANAIFVEIIY